MFCVVEINQGALIYSSSTYIYCCCRFPASFTKWDFAPVGVGLINAGCVGVTIVFLVGRDDVIGFRNVGNAFWND